jgi:hypothetical protein
VRPRCAPTARGRLRWPAKVAIELVTSPVDGSHHGLQRYRPDPEIALAAPAERGDDLLEGQHRRHVVRLGAQPGDDARQRPAAPLAREVRPGVLVR